MMRRTGVSQWRLPLQPREVVANLSYRQGLISLGCIAICLLGSITWPGGGWIWAEAAAVVARIRGDHLETRPAR